MLTEDEMFWLMAAIGVAMIVARLAGIGLAMIVAGLMIPQ